MNISAQPQTAIASNQQRSVKAYRLLQLECKFQQLQSKPVLQLSRTYGLLAIVAQNVELFHNCKIGLSHVDLEAMQKCMLTNDRCGCGVAAVQLVLHQTPPNSLRSIVTLAMTKAYSCYFSL